MERKVIIAGSGGQGILFLGKVLAFASMAEGKKVTWFPSYGAEMRGGTANCTVIISDEMIGSPVVYNPDILIVMNAASLLKFQDRLKGKGLLFYDSSLIRKPLIKRSVSSISVPATGMAGSIGNTKSANMVMLGALIARTRLLKTSSVTNMFEGPALTTNTEAIMKGIRHIEHTKG